MREIFLTEPVAGRVIRTLRSVVLTAVTVRKLPEVGGVFPVRGRSQNNTVVLHIYIPVAVGSIWTRRERVWFAVRCVTDRWITNRWVTDSWITNRWVSDRWL